jgi:uncharacterized protein (DUF302 family)
MLFQLPTSRSMAEIQQELEASAARNKFGVIAVHDLQQIMRNKSVDLAFECKVFEVCNPHQAKKVLETDGILSAALPCRISVYGTPGHYNLTTMLPTAMMEAFNKPEITAVAKEVEDVIVTMMKDSAGTA